MRKARSLAVGVLFLLLVFSPVRVAQAVDAADDPAGYLEEQGYVVTDVREGKFKDTGKPYAMVTMDWESKELWSVDTSTQAAHGFFALRAGYPQAVAVFVDLLYSQQYEIVWRTNVAEWDKYQKDSERDKTKAWETFRETLWIGVWDNDAGAYMEGSELRSFTRKNFGSGAAAEPKSLTAVKGPTYGSVTLEASKTQVKLKGQVEIQVKVLDKQKDPVARAPVDLVVSGSAAGSRTAPKSVTTGDDGTASATFIAGSKDGAAMITATSRGTVGTLIIQVGKGESDPGPTKVTQSLQQQGYKVLGVGKASDDPNSVYVEMQVAGAVADRNGKLDPETVTQVIDGWTALVDAYPKATLLKVITRTPSFGVHWSVGSQDFKAYMDNKTSEQVFWEHVWSTIKIYDLKTNKEVAPKDFLSKNAG
jgi:hypothetical protein